MISKIDINSNGYKVDEPFRKYVEKRLGKLDKYLPRKMKKGTSIKVTINEIGKNKSEKYDIAATADINGGKVIVAKDECTNVFAGVDLVEAKLTGQIRRYKLEVQPHRQKRGLKKLFRRKG